MAMRLSFVALAGLLVTIGAAGRHWESPAVADDEQAAAVPADDTAEDTAADTVEDSATVPAEDTAAVPAGDKASDKASDKADDTEKTDGPESAPVATKAPTVDAPAQQPTPPTTTTPPTNTTARQTPAVSKKAVPVAPAPVAPAPAAVASPPKKPVLVPGTGSIVKGVGDDFEDAGWKWNYNHPKSSEEQDKRTRSPMGRSINGRWFEGPKRGTPDVVKRIELPAPGLEGSTHGLLIASLHAGIPGKVTYQMQQDDLIYNMQKVTGRGISVVDSPSVVTRVYMPPFEQWEKRNGPSFGFRAGCYTHATITGKDHPDKGRFGLEEYWPGMFVCFEPANAKRKTPDSAHLRIRGGRNGGEIRGPKIDETGWWTLGLSFSPDGMVHYFASKGVDDLTMDDHITSQFPYGYRTELLKTFFYNVCTRDDDKTWSTPWVIDDPKVYFVKRQVASTPKSPTRR